MSYYGYFIDSDSDIAHHGVKGMKWGVRKEIRRTADYWMGARDLKIRSRKRNSELRSAMRNTNDKAKRREYRKQLHINNRDRLVAEAPLPIWVKSAYGRGSENKKRIMALTTPLMAAASPMTAGSSALVNASQNAAIAYTNHKLKKSQRS